MKRKLCISLVSIAFFVSSGCAVLDRKPQRELTPEEVALQNQMMQALINKMNNSSAPPKNNQPMPTAQGLTTKISATELKQKLDAFEKNGTNNYSFEQDRDGIKINGKPFLDPAGKIISSGNNTITGDFTYIIQQGGNFEIKYSNASNTENKIEIAKARKLADGFEATTSTGQTLSGNRIIPTSKGFIVTRETSAFQYHPETDNITSISAPSSYHVAYFQNGDIDSSGYILFEKDPEQNPAKSGDLIGTTTKLFNVVRDAASLTGAVDPTKKDGYKLIEIKSGKEITLDISTEDKDVQVGRNCKRASSVHNLCDSFDSFEALYKPDGFKNYGHYFWRAQWFSTPSGKFAIVQEQRLRNLNIINLDTGERVNLFSRPMGISGFDVIQHPDGRISITAKMGLSQEKIEDAVAEFKARSNQNASL